MARIKMRINSREDQSIERYLEEINRVSLLKPDEEIELAKRSEFEVCCQRGQRLSESGAAFKRLDQ